ncbi:MAG: hypothetical protein ACRERU_09605 [Methylococcales bacterium]
MGDGLMRGAALLTIVLLVACHQNDDPRVQEAAAAFPLSAPAPASYSKPPPEYTVKGHVLRLVVTGEACVIEHRVNESEIGKLTLDLRPPCYLLTWRQIPANTKQEAGVSDGVPVGAIGDPMAWQYASAGGVVALAVIGDPFPEKLRLSNLYRLREQQGLTCAPSVQAILLHGNQIRLSKKREHVNVFCAELGLEERDFWMLSPPSSR